MNPPQTDKKAGLSWIFLYGPPGSGKTTVGVVLAEQLGVPFYDLDDRIEVQTGCTIQFLFTNQGEPVFRQLESSALLDLLNQPRGVVALGGGTLLDAGNRGMVEQAGVVLALQVPEKILLERLGQPAIRGRPLLTGDVTYQLHELLEKRAAHYASFQDQLDIRSDSQAELAWRVQVRLGLFNVTSMGKAYPVQVQDGSLQSIGAVIGELGLAGPIALVHDTRLPIQWIQLVHTSLSKAGLTVVPIAIPAGEKNKTIRTAGILWDGFLKAGLERSSTVVALGGGVVGDLTGFAAATYLRGVRWVVLPTTLLAMVDASLGGKTAADLPQGKNLIGAFHPPSLVMVDPTVLQTLPEVEIRNGMAEVVKHGLIGDLELFELVSQGWDSVSTHLDEIIRRGMAVKIRVIQTDPYEKGNRATLNLGHTFGHALELASGYRLRHGEAVAIGMVLAGRLAERLNLAEPALSQKISSVLLRLGLPIEIPDNIDPQAIEQAMIVDKKRSFGKIQFVLPLKVGQVRYGVEVDWQPGEFIRNLWMSSNPMGKMGGT